ncbi:noroxomaritidine synthase 3-like [Phragmites australis]|uniref:noroxomaritidine synthase 3-like n=1 Tax=Phragmites australis TaxID=29695 RepID=UPI002D79D936|nr:noroxomaritidine synthase 3-like [Phragmites australis]
MPLNGPQFRSFAARCSRGKVENSLLPFLAHTANEGWSCDLNNVFLRLTLDLNCTLVSGVNPGCLAIGSPVVPSFARAMDDALETLFLRHITPATCWKLMKRLEVGQEKKMAVSQRTIDSFVTATIEKCRAHKLKECISNLADLLPSFICSEDTSHNDDVCLRDTMVNLLVVGRDGTGVALSWFFYLISKNPHVKQKLLDELAPIASKKVAARPNSGMVTFDASELNSLVYMHAALCECLRP